MADFTLGGAQQFDASGQTAAGSFASASSLTKLAGSGTANAYGSWEELIASVPFDAQGFFLQWWATGDNARRFDLGLGSAGNEEVILEKMNGWGQDRTGAIVYVPLNIPAGIRLAARGMVEDLTTADIFAVGVILVGPEFASIGGYSYCDVFGNDSAYGVRLPDGASDDTKGSWTEIVSSTPRDIRALIISTGVDDVNTGVQNEVLIDIGIGGSGSEVTLLEDLQFGKDNSHNAATPMGLGAIPVTIPAGTRIAARQQMADVSDSAEPRLTIHGIG